VTACDVCSILGIYALLFILSFEIKWEITLKLTLKLKLKYIFSSELCYIIWYSLLAVTADRIEHTT
jgi:hypothetical protein